MALIFLGVLIIVTISSFELQQVLLPDLTANDECPQIQPTGLSDLGAMLESSQMLQQKSQDAQLSQRDRAAGCVMYSFRQK